MIFIHRILNFFQLFIFICSFIFHSASLNFVISVFIIANRTRRSFQFSFTSGSEYQPYSWNSKWGRIHLESIKSPFSSQCKKLCDYIGSKMDFWWTPIVQPIILTIFYCIPLESFGSKIDFWWTPIVFRVARTNNEILPVSIIG